jgi:3'-phosphoadenosine 5'-phosphosulfate sulfotransferase (PAPS reductase)/FAD synthetase
MTQQVLAQPRAGQYELSHLLSLEAEAIHIIREVAAEFERPVLLFSGGKDSIVMLHLAIKAFAPARLPFPVMHVDTGHNFDEVIATRDELVARHGLRLVVGSVEEDIDAGRVVDNGPSRNPLQTVTLLRALRENREPALTLSLDLKRNNGATIATVIEDAVRTLDTNTSNVVLIGRSVTSPDAIAILVKLTVNRDNLNKRISKGLFLRNQTRRNKSLQVLL